MGASYFLSPHVSDATIVTATSSAAGAGPENVQKGRPSLYWRSGGGVDTLTFDMGAAVEVDTLGLGWINGESSDTFRLRGADTEANLTAAPTADSTALNVWPSGADLSDYILFHRHYELPQTYTLRWWSITFGFNSNSLGYVRTSRAMLGKRMEFAKPLSFPAGFTITESVAETVDFGGEEAARARGVKRSTALNFSWASEAEWRMAQRAMLRRGSSGDVMAVLQKDNAESHAELTYIGRVKEPQTSSVPSHNRFGLLFTISEAGPLLMRG